MNAMVNKIAVAGNLIVDYVKMIDSFPGQGRLVNISNTSRCVGGCAANTSVGLSLMDSSVQVQAIGRVGNDENGRFITDTLKQKGVTPRVIIDAIADTSFTDVMTVQGSGERTFFHARGANASFGIEDIDLANLSCDLFHIGYILLLDRFDAEDPEYGTVMARLLAQVKQKGIKTSLDVVSENSGRFKKLVIPSLKYCDYLIINEVEASLVTDIPVRGPDGILLSENMPKLCKRLLELGVSDMAAVHAPEGGWAMMGDGQAAYAPSVPLDEGQIKGKVGAGDAFCAGVLYGICKGYDLEYTLRYAAAAAACNLTAKNSIDGMRDRQGIIKMLETGS